MDINVIETDLPWAHALTPRSITDLIILHHQAGEGSVEDLHCYHLSKGWAGIAYNYFVRLDGSIYRGRPEHMQGGHTKGYNARSIGICAEGNFEERTMPAGQREALRALVQNIRTRYPDTRTVRHCDLAATACPGRNYPYEYIAADEPDPDDTDSDAKWVAERELARAYVMDAGISDGLRGGDPLKREEYWVMLYRQSQKGGEG